MNELKIFESEEFGKVGVIPINGEPYFDLYDVGMALGQTKESKGILYPRKDRIDKNVENAEIKPVVHNNIKYIDINGVRKLISLSHTNSKSKDNFICFLKENGYLEFNEVFSFTRKEILFIEELEKVLEPLDIEVIRQYPILSYRIDCYIPKFKLAIEYDENDHDYYSYENQELRQQNIEKELGCKFLRINDSNNNLYNIGIVVKEIIEQLNEVQN